MFLARQTQIIYKEKKIEVILAKTISCEKHRQ